METASLIDDARGWACQRRDAEGRREGLDLLLAECELCFRLGSSRRAGAACLLPLW